jgi:hypothetical protein
LQIEGKKKSKSKILSFRRLLLQKIVGSLYWSIQTFPSILVLIAAMVWCEWVEEENGSRRRRRRKAKINGNPN